MKLISVIFHSKISILNKTLAGEFEKYVKRRFLLKKKSYKNFQVEKSLKDWRLRPKPVFIFHPVRTKSVKFDIKTANFAYWASKLKVTTFQSNKQIKSISDVHLKKPNSKLESPKRNSTNTENKIFCVQSKWQNAFNDSRAFDVKSSNLTF